MTDSLMASYDDGETRIYEVRAPVSLSVLRPSDADRQALRERRVAPFPRGAWVAAEDVEVQVSFTLANLDADAHSVEILIDAWNEFGRYWPGLQIIDADDGEALPNLSGIDVRREVPGREDPLGRSSRVHGTFTFADMHELAADFATVINIIENVAGDGGGDGTENPRIALINHTFNTKNRQGSTPLTDRYTPELIPGLTGFDIGLRTAEPANIAIEFVVEIIDHTGERIRPAGESDPILREPDRFYTLGGG